MQCNKSIFYIKRKYWICTLILLTKLKLFWGLQIEIKLFFCCRSNKIFEISQSLRDPEQLHIANPGRPNNDIFNILLNALWLQACFILCRFTSYRVKCDVFVHCALCKYACVELVQVRRNSDRLQNCNYDYSVNVIDYDYDCIAIFHKSNRLR